MIKRIALLTLAAAALLAARTHVSSFDANSVQITLNASAQVLESHSEIDLSTVYPDAFIIGEHGGPALPSYRIIIGLPPEGRVDIDYNLSGFRELTGVKLTSYQVPGIGDQPEAIERWADDLAQVSYEITRWRDYRIAVVDVVPVRYDYDTRSLTTYGEISLDVRFESSGISSIPTPDPMDRIYAATLANYEQCRDWKLATQTSQDEPFGQGGTWVKVSIPADGVYRISFQDLRRLGVDPREIDPRTVRLLYPGPRSPEDDFPDTLTELPVYVHGEDDGTFHRYDYILFFARGANRWNFTHASMEINPYVTENVYWLTWGRENGTRLQTRAGYPSPGDGTPTAQAVMHFEQDKECPGRSGLLWLWRKIIKGTTTKADTLGLDITGVKKVDTFTVRLYAATEDGGFRALAGGDTILPDIQVYRGVLSDPDYTVIEPVMDLSDELELVIEVFGAGQQEFYVDWVRIVGERNLTFKTAPMWIFMDGSSTYRISDVGSTPFIFDVTDPDNPVMITDWGYESGDITISPRSSDSVPIWLSDENHLLTPALELEEPGGLWNADWAVDYIIISTIANMEAASELASYRNENLELEGISSPRVTAVSIDDVVRDFGYGLAEPQAIRHFLSYAYQQGGGRPVYVLLFGDGTYDYKNNKGYTGRPEYLPIYTSGYVIDPNVYVSSAAAKDGWFVDFDEASRFSPEMSIARITARDGYEAFTVVEKIKNYDSGPRGAWAARAILLSDDYYYATPSHIDTISNHIPANENIARLLTPEFDIDKVYLSDYALVGGRKPDAEQALLDALNRGALLWMFFGHGKGDQLTHEQVFMNTDVPQVHNENRLPFAMFCSCGVGRFEDDKWECVAEDLVRSPEGAIATIGATKGTGAGSNLVLSDSLIRIFSNLRHLNVGDLFFALGNPPNSYGNPRKDPLYHLFGDPGVRLHYPTLYDLVEEPSEFATGDTASLTFIPPSTSSNWFSSAYGSWVYRVEPVWNKSYYSRGNLYYRAAGEIIQDTTTLKFIVPLDTAEGNRAYWHVVCVGEDSLFTYRADSIPVTQGQDPVTDNQGPNAHFYFADNELVTGDTVPVSFILTIELDDPSGINLTGLSGIGSGPSEPLSLVINEESKIELAPYFEYEVQGSTVATRGTASVPVYLSREDNTLTLYAVDNVRNLSSYELTLYSTLIRDLQIVDALVYPNPVSSSADFTFELNAQAEVSVQIFTISGRLVKKLEPVSYPAGFGTYTWDGTDSYLRPLPNGVYIYRLNAVSEDESLTGSRTSAAGKLIVTH